MSSSEAEQSIARREFIGLACAVAAAAAGAEAHAMTASADIAAGAARLAGVGPQWIGGAALAGGKGYASCSLGQVHYRAIGPSGRTPFLLIHQTPVGLAEYVDVQSALARAGRHSIAPDNPGYGFSDPVSGTLTVAQIADNLRQLLNFLGVPRVLIAGHHTGAAIAASFAARHPEQTAGVVLHGTPLYTAQERAERLARPSANLTLREDGSHFADIFRAVGKHAGIDPQSLSSISWATIGTFLAGASSPVYKAIFSNDMQADLKAIRAPALVLTDTGDVLHANDQRVLELRPDFKLQTFSDGGSFALMREPQRWAQTLLDFATAKGL